MKWRDLTWRSLGHHWRTHLGVVLGAILGAAVLGGALLVGSSVRESLLQMGLMRLGNHYFAIDSGDRFFRVEMLGGFEPNHSLSGHVSAERFPDAGKYVLSDYPISMLRLEGTVSKQDGTARANQVWVYGAGAGNVFRPEGGVEGVAAGDAMQQAVWDARVNLPSGGVILNEALASQLAVKPGDSVVIRVRKPGALSRDAVITPRDDQSFALRVTVHTIMSGVEGGNLGLSPSQTPPLNAFVRLDELDQPAGLQGRVNLALLPPLIWREGEGDPTRNPWFVKWSEIWRKISGRGRGPGMDSRPVVNQQTQSALYSEAIRHVMTEADAELQMRKVPGQDGQLELISRRIFLDDTVVKALNETAPKGTGSKEGVGSGTDLPTRQGLLTYLVNQLQAGEHAVPYSMVTAAGPPWVPADLAADEIVINDWLAGELKVGVGGTVDVSYYLLDTGSQLTERTNRFRVRQVVPMTGVYGDRTLMPEFPGLTKAESTRDWDAGFKLVHPIRDQDEAYWKKHRGTPKAFISLETGQKLWANRFGAYTSMRFTIPTGADFEQMSGGVARHLLSHLKPESVGLGLIPVREQAEHAASNSQDFGGLFIGFSFFLILSALVLVSMLFRFGLEQRQSEVGLLMALGFTPKRVRRLFLWEGFWLAAFGCAVGAVLAVAYARGVIHGLNTIWKDAVSTSSLAYYPDPATLVMGAGIAWVLALLTLALGLRKLGSKSPRALMSGYAEEPSTLAKAGSKGGRGSSIRWAMLWIGAALGLDLFAWIRSQTVEPVIFFLSGAMALVGGILAVSGFLKRLERGSVLGGSAGRAGLSLSGLATSGLGRRRTRSLATAILLASGSFLVLSIGVNRLDADRGAGERSSGTGGFEFLGQSTLPIVDRLDSEAGQESLGLDKSVLKGVGAVPFRVRAGDDASCLNLNRAQRPRLLGVKSSLLTERGAFRFAGAMKGLDVKQGWDLLRTKFADGAIPAIGDAASIQWAMGRGLGDDLNWVDEAGREFKVRLVAGLANSILQGSLVMDEEEFLKRFPSNGGHQWFLLDALPGAEAAVSAELSRGLRNQGMEVISASKRLSEFNAVQNTYLSTFQVLGGLGLILGSVGLGVVLLRNALERRGEFAVLRAVGFTRGRVNRLILREHLWLLWAGLGVGLGAAMVAVLPVWLTPGGSVPVRLLVMLVGGVALVGMASTWLAARWAMRGGLLENLRSE